MEQLLVIPLLACVWAVLFALLASLITLAVRKWRRRRAASEPNSPVAWGFWRISFCWFLAFLVVFMVVIAALLEANGGK